MVNTLYMVVEHYKNDDAAPVYRRLRDHGRMAPEGVVFVSSWVDRAFARCYQLMETANPKLLDEWVSHWSDIVDFEVFPVMTTEEAVEKIEPLL